MLRGVIISSDLELGVQLERFLLELGQVGIVRRLDRYASGTELNRLLRAQAPQVVFVGVEVLPKAAETVRMIEATYPGLPVVAFHRECNPQILLETMRAGIREFLSFPFDRENISDAVNRIRQQLDSKPPAFQSSDLMFSFLPSKAGVGASTLAMNVAIALAAPADTTALLADFDLNSGMIRFMLKLDTGYCVTDAAEHAMEMDEELWPQLVTAVGQLDVLHAGRLNPDFRIEAQQMAGMLDFIRRNYQVSCLDLSGNMERYSMEIMHESRRIFLVCTPELPSLHLAREKYLYLEQMDLGDRVSVLLNRCQKRPVISPQQIQQLLGLPVHMTFPNDYQGVHRALTLGKPVEPSSELGRQCFMLAQSLVQRKPALVPNDPKKRFIEFFNVNPNAGNKMMAVGEVKKPG
jgi:pilus assembly protein CpaE